MFITLSFPSIDQTRIDLMMQNVSYNFERYDIRSLRTSKRSLKLKMKPCNIIQIEWLPPQIQLNIYMLFRSCEWHLRNKFAFNEIIIC